MAAFDLWTDGVTLVDRMARLFNKHNIARDPMSGIVDSSNTTFYVNHPPVLTSGSVGIYTSGSVPLAASGYTLDYDYGAVFFNTAPAVQPSATYTTAKYSDRIIKSILVAGFDEMENLWFRGFSLSEQLSSIVWVDEDSPVAYVVDSSGSDPQFGSQYFSTSHNQQGLFVKCVQLAFYRTLMGDHALSDFIWKEAQGLSIDKSMTVRNLELAYKATEKAVQTALMQAQVEQLGDAAFGGAIVPLYTREFIAHRFWQKASSDEQWRLQTQYRGQVW